MLGVGLSLCRRRFTFELAVEITRKHGGCLSLTKCAAWGRTEIRFFGIDTGTYNPNIITSAKVWATGAPGHYSRNTGSL